MKSYKKAILGPLLAFATAQSAAAGPVVGTTTNFQSPRGITESCVAIDKLPLGKYSEKDTEKEAEFCNLDFYNNSVALCAKTWATSAATLIRDNSKSGKSTVQAEAAHCDHASPLDTIAKFKQTMNRVDTSGTYSNASLLYYHFSRALDVTVDIPVAVYRSMDKVSHYNRVTSKAENKGSKMNFNAWNHMRAAEKNPAYYSPVSDLFTADTEQIYGIIAKDKGERYGVEVNGTRASGWGKGQNLDFQKTPGFMALRSSQSMPEAIQDGISQSFKDPKMAKAFASVRPSETQVALWMKELSEIAILDYIFSQQDRVGNTDYRWYWVFQGADGKVQVQKEDSELSLLKKSAIKPPAAIANMNPVLVQKTAIGDNDAGAMVSFANFTKATGMLENIRHINPETYRRLFQLALDFEQQGPNYQVLVKSFGLRADSLKQTVANTKLAATILLKSCEAKTLRFDLVSYKDAYQKKYQEVSVDCRNP